MQRVRGLWLVAGLCLALSLAWGGAAALAADPLPADDTYVLIQGQSYKSLTDPGIGRYNTYDTWQYEDRSVNPHIFYNGEFRGEVRIDKGPGPSHKVYCYGLGNYMYGEPWQTRADWFYYFRIRPKLPQAPTDLEIPYFVDITGYTRMTNIQSAGDYSAYANLYLKPNPSKAEILLLQLQDPSSSLPQTQTIHHQGAERPLVLQRIKMYASAVGHAVWPTIVPPTPASDLSRALWSAMVEQTVKIDPSFMVQVGESLLPADQVYDIEYTDSFANAPITSAAQPALPLLLSE